MSKIKYTLLNKLNNNLLVHPRFGLWFTFELSEAKSMLNACKEYIKADGMDTLQDNFVIVDADSKQEI